MPRIARVVAVGAPHHVTQRGNNRQQVFYSDNQRRSYLALLADHAARHRLRILGYCLMPNHVHAVVVPGLPDSMSKAFGRAHNSYSRYLNALRHRTGHLWQNRFYSMPLGREHLRRALRYVDMNPVRSRLVEQALDYPWSSARAHATGRDPYGLLDQDLWHEVCPLGDWDGVLKADWAADTDWMHDFRAATLSGKPLVNEGLVAKMEAETGHDLRLRKPGRPRKRPLPKAIVRAAHSE